MLQRVIQKARGALRRHALDALDYRGLTIGTRIEIERPGTCVLKSFEENLPGPQQILVESLATAVSPGTERSIFVGNPRLEYPLVPGYSTCGRVAVAGPGSSFRVGEIVATRGHHASLCLASDGDAVAVPEGVAPEHAAIIHIAYIAFQGVQKAGIRPGDRVVVLGSGLIGQLAAQLAQVAGGVVTLAATSERRRAMTLECGVRDFLNTSAEPDRLASLGAAIVIEASGSPQALLDALRAAGPKAQIILLGSTKGITTGIDPALWAGKEVTLVGAHVNLTFHPEAGDGRSRWRRDARYFLDLVAKKRVILSPLLKRRFTPDQVAEVYATLLDSRTDDVGLTIDWSAEGPWRPRIDRVSPLRVVSTTARRVLGTDTSGSKSAPSRARADNRRLGVGLIGCGEIAVQSADAINRCPSARIVFTTDPTEALARGLAAESGASYTTNAADLLASPDVEVVVISTPHHLHLPLAVQALEAGKHVIVEKPMATKLSDCDEMLAVAKRKGRVLSVVYLQRFDPRVRAARELLQAGAVGTIRGTRIVFGQFRDSAYFQSGLTGRTTSDWRSRPDQAGGGVLIMNACHILDYMSWLVDEPVASVAAFKSSDGTDRLVEQSLTMSYAYQGGALGTLEATVSLAGPHQYEQQIRGSSGQMTVAPALRFWSNKPVRGYDPGRWHSPRIDSPGQERRLYFDATINAILDGVEPPVTGDSARQTQAIIEAAYLSAARGSAVRLDELD